MKRSITGFERCRLILDSKPEWEFWVLGENILRLWKECEWLLPEERKGEIAKMITIFFSLRNRISSNPWICTGHVTGLGQQETGKWEAWSTWKAFVLDAVGTVCQHVNETRLDCCMRDGRWPSCHHSVNFLKQIYWADQNLTTDE